MGFVAHRDANSSIAFPSEPTPASFETVRVMSVALAVVLMVIVVVWMGAVARALRKMSRARSENKRQAATKQTMRELMAFLVCCLGLNVVVVFNLEVRMGWYACSIMGMIPSVFYSMVRFYGYRVLLMRAKTVEAIMPTWLKILQRLVSLGTYGVFVIIAMVIIAFSGKIIFEEEICTQSVGTLAPLVGAVLDTCLSASLLIVFVVPVLQHSRIESRSSYKSGQAATPGSVPRANKLRNVAIRNLVLSSFSIGTSLFFMVAVVILRVPDDSQDLDVQHRRLFSCYGASLDSFGNATVFILMYRKLLFPDAANQTVHPSGPPGDPTGTPSGETQTTRQSQSL